MMTVSLIGTGNVAWHLANAITQNNVLKLVEVWGKNESKLEEFDHIASTISSYKDLRTVDLLIIAVKDDAIIDVAKKLPKRDWIVVHTSGSIAIDVLKKHFNHGVIYPLQTFSKNRKTDFKTVPLCIEASSNDAMKSIKIFANSLSDTVQKVNSDQRSALHLAAVFANNFGNHILTEAEEICKEKGVPFTMLRPLMQETIAKAFDLGPSLSQTGPAIRNDQMTIRKQLKSLDTKEQHTLYSVLTEAITKHYGKEKL